MPAKINIAIDGFSSTGKSTLAKELAGLLGYRYIDTGAMYRAVTLYALEQGMIHDDNLNSDALIAALPQIKVGFEWNEDSGSFQVALNGEIAEPAIRSMEVARNVSPVATISEIRKFLVEQQKAMARGKGVVMDGRDIASVVIPDAELKIFVTASQDIREKRRYDELTARGHKLTMAEVAENLRRRDEIDSTREDSPLRRTEDALILDNSHLSRQEQLDLALGWAQERIRATQQA